MAAPEGGRTRAGLSSVGVAAGGELKASVCCADPCALPFESEHPARPTASVATVAISPDVVVCLACIMRHLFRNYGLVPASWKDRSAGQGQVREDAVAGVVDG